MASVADSADSGNAPVTCKIRVRNLELQFSDADVVEPDEFIPSGEYNPHDIHPWLLHDHGFPVAIVFASCLQDALDAAVDADKMDRYLIGPSDYTDYGVNTDDDRACYLGNASEPFDIDSLGFVELSNPPFSFAALCNAAPPVVRGSHFA